MAIAGIQFQLPAHPGLAPQHATGANAVARQETTCLYETCLKELATAITVMEEIKKQILATVDHIYLATLDDDIFGFADVGIDTMLTHLCNTYATITQAELEHNRASIATIWTPEAPIEILWEGLHKIQLLSVAGNNPLSDTTLKDLTFTMFKNTSVFTMACDTWHICPVATQTLDDICAYFTSKNKEQLHKLTMSQVGFHSANAANTVSNAASRTLGKTTTIAPPLMPSPTPSPSALPMPLPIITNDGIHMYYCWTHGLGFNHNHTSATCSNPADGHNTSATVKNMHGSNSTIMSNHHRPKPE